MIKRWLTLLLAVMFVFVYAGSAFALTVSSNSTTFSGKINFMNRVNTYSVTYHANGGGEPSPIDANHYGINASFIAKGQESMTPPAGTNFSGWSTDSNAKTASIIPGQEVKTDGKDIDLYAVWTAAEPVTITYHFKDVNGVVASPVKKSYVKDEAIELPTLTSLGFAVTPGNGAKAWYSDSAMSVLVGNPGQPDIVTANKEYYAEEVPAGGEAEYSAVIIWEDAADYQEMRPSISTLMNRLALTPAAPDTAVVSGSSVDGNTWKLIWSGLKAGEAYKLVPPEVEGYGIKEASSGTTSGSITYKREVGEAIMTMWITNKKWDKYGDLIKFKAGQTVRFRMDITNVGNGPLHHVQLYECLKGARFIKADGYKVTSDGYAYIGDLGVGQTVSVWATYRVTNSDTRKEKVANVAGVDFMREDKTWGSDGDAVRIPINRKSSTSSATAKPTATPIPTATPVPVQAYMVEKLVSDLATISLAYPTATIDVVGAQEILTPEEYAVYQKLTTQEKVLTVLNSIGFERLIPVERLRLNLQVSETALNLMNNIYVRKQGMTAEQKTAQQAKENLYFPKQSVTSNGFTQNYFEMALRITNNGKVRTDRYTFREEPTTGQWTFVRAVSEQ